VSNYEIVVELMIEQKENQEGKRIANKDGALRGTPRGGALEKNEVL